MRQEGLRFEPKRNLFSSPQHQRILLSPAPSPSPERLSGRQALRYVTKHQIQTCLELFSLIQPSGGVISTEASVTFIPFESETILSGEL